LVKLKDGREIKFGLMVWSTGVGPTDLVKSLTALKQDSHHRVITDDHLRVYIRKDGQQNPPKTGNNQEEDDKESYELLKNVFALGDCATVEKTKQAQTAQVAKQKGYYLAKTLNKVTLPEEVQRIFF